MVPRRAPATPPAVVIPGYGAPMQTSESEEAMVDLGDSLTEQMLVPSLNKPSSTGGVGFESAFKGCPPRRPVSRSYTDLVKEALEMRSKVMKVVPYGETEASMAIREAQEAVEREKDANAPVLGTEAIPNDEHGAEFVKLIRPLRGKLTAAERDSATRYLAMKGGQNGTGGAEAGISIFARASPLEACMALSKRSFRQGELTKKKTPKKTPGRTPKRAVTPVPVDNFSFEQAEWVKIRLKQFSGQAMEDVGMEPSHSPAFLPFGSGLGETRVGLGATVPAISPAMGRGGQPGGMDDVEEIIRQMNRKEQWDANLHKKPFKV